VKSLGQLEQEAQRGECTLVRYCAEVAMMFRVRPHEVAVMELRHSMLHFAYPPELRKTGLIPLISSAQAAKTATTKRAEIFNNFAAIRHSSVFETIKVSGENGQAIQRLMSAPILSPEGDVLGVMQISRKGATPMDSGAEFEASDLQTLRDVTNSFGRVAKQLLDRSAEIPKVEFEPGQVLTR
jgi:hypothetical protein